MKRVLLWAAAVLGAAALILGSAWFVLFRVNEFSLEVTPEGEESVILEYGETFDDPGATAVLRGTLVLRDGMPPKTIQWTREGAVDSEKLGSYTIDYTASCWIFQGTGRRRVEVVDTTPPELTFTSDGPMALDNHDGDITDRIHRTPEPGFFLYTVEDDSGNRTQVRREREELPPDIILDGGDYMTIYTGTVFEDPGYWAVDETGDLTDTVDVSGEVLWYQSGTYPITYTVRDPGGRETTVIRTVEVTPRPQPEIIEPRAGTIFLTFDDGPGPYTMELLDVLDTYGVKATFFVTDTGYDGVMKEIVDRGHSIGIHTVSHDYKKIYDSPEAYFRDLYEMQNIIYENTGVRTTLMRFPGGSSNTVSVKTCEGLMTTLTQAVQDAGFQYFDWNIDSNDAGGARDAETVAENVINGMANQGTGIVLQHDIHPYSVAAIEEILVWALNNGYRFEPLTPNTPGFHHGVNN